MGHWEDGREDTERWVIGRMGGMLLKGGSLGGWEGGY